MLTDPASTTATVTIDDGTVSVATAARGSSISVVKVVAAHYAHETVVMSQCKGHSHGVLPTLYIKRECCGKVNQLYLPIPSILSFHLFFLKLLELYGKKINMEKGCCIPYISAS